MMRSLLIKPEYTFGLSLILAGCNVLTTPVQGSAGPQGKDGADGKNGVDGKDGVDGKNGADGKDGLPGTLLPTPSCPFGYTQKGVAPPTVCVAPAGGQDDELVRVGTGATAFWIDRYEATLFYENTNTQLSDPTSEPTFPGTGQWIGLTTPVYAASVRGVTPTSYVTWFQASEACRARGKRLPTPEEWLSAARGTPDLGSSDGEGVGKCNTNSQLGEPRVAGIDSPQLGISCVSAWGAEDMIGNLWEFTSEWYAGLQVPEAPPVASANPWPGNFDVAASYGINGSVFGSTYAAGRSTGLPVVGVRGGGYVTKVGAGILAIWLECAPSMYYPSIGFRCVLPR